MNIKWNILRLGSIYKKFSRPINAINHLPPSSQYAKWGWCAAMTLRQYLVCRECRKVAQHCTNSYFVYVTDILYETKRILSVCFL
jgi:hypothetical protein